jgi:heat shock protein HtpX
MTLNGAKTFLLLAILTALFGACGLMIGGAIGMLIALGIAGAMNIFSIWFSDKAVLKMYKARQVADGALHDMVADLAMRAGLPMPKVYIIDTPQPNAFATGRSPRHAAVAATTGIMRTLNEGELRGVMAHELAHIKNRDTLTMTIVATLAGALGMVAKFGRLMGRGGGRARSSRGGANPLAMVGIMAAVIIAPFIAMVIRMTVSRVREYSADRDGALICGKPLDLASALVKIHNAAHNTPNAAAEDNPETAHMFIINPLIGKGGKIDSLFSTHPNTENRIAALKDMHGVISSHSSNPSSRPSSYRGGGAKAGIEKPRSYKNPWT